MQGRCPTQSPARATPVRPEQRPFSSSARLAGLVATVVLVAGPAGAVPPNMTGCDLVPIADHTQVVVTTPLGSMRIVTYSTVAPLTVANFIAYIQSGAYDGSVVHRVVPSDGVNPDFVVQTGGYRIAGSSYEAVETVDPVANEPCLSNVRGTVAMAKVDNQPNSATSQWFVNLDDANVFLDTQNGGFTVFGEVVEGMDVADAIVGLPQRPDQLLVPYLATVSADLRLIFRQTPLASDIVEPGVVGCFDPDQSGAVLVEDPQSVGDLEPEVATGAPFTIASAACLGVGTDGSPAFPCTDPGRRVLLIDPTDGSLIPDGQAPFGFAEVTLSCADLAASEIALQQRLQAVDIAGSLVQTSYALPEPGMPLLCGTTLLCLAALRRRRERPRHRGR